jgi:hypothetical protein
MLELKEGWLQRQMAIVSRNVNTWGAVNELRLKQKLVRDCDPPITKYQLQADAIRIMRQALSEWKVRIDKELIAAQKSCSHVMVDAVPGACGFGYDTCNKCGITDL